ncbi:MAG: deoxyguanosinetriphosphate triphosphohydrolase [Planctomycetes bacterium]|nr:deoxyguanosinetriphosphate triphosphohydrolase [Planctomycetota bacterium]
MSDQSQGKPENPNASPRELFEARQSDWLAACAVKESQSGGRKYDEPEHPYRTCFQRDRDRVIHCSAFRRLDFKTQVFVPHEQDHYRTRLTHTLEVAQIGRSLARALRANEDLVEAVSLAHDLGHPPFGHGGEAVLDELMAEHGHFEHNRQSLRIVDYLEHPYPHFRGLNLTRAVRLCIARHSTRYDAPVCEDFDPAGQAPLEGQLADLADEIAYTSADLEDSLTAGLLTLERLDSLELWRRAWQTAQADAPDARPIHKQIRACKAVLAILADDLIETTRRQLSISRPAGPDDVCRADRKLAAFSDPTARQLRQMQDYLLHNVYLAGDNAKKDADCRKVIGGLFSDFAARPDLLPDRYRLRSESDGLHRIICDYIAGMTDRFCLQQHEKFRGSKT